MEKGQLPPVNVFTKMLSGRKITSKRPITEEVELKAKRRLTDSIAFWGITDHWVDTVCLFNKQYRVSDNVKAVQVQNSKPNARADILRRACEKNDRAMRLVEKSLRADIALFNWAEGEFQQRRKRDLSPGGCQVVP